jgi:hypothetical protein
MTKTSMAAVKAWNTRRSNITASKQRLAAFKAWATRRKNQKVVKTTKPLKLNAALKAVDKLNLVDARRTLKIVITQIYNLRSK